MIIKLQNGDKFKIESNEKREARKKYKEYSLLPIGLKLKRNINIASNFLKSGPNITNFGNAVSALFGGYSPENPDLHYGEAPGVGIKNFGNLVKTARVTREFNDVVKGPINTLLKTIKSNDSKQNVYVPDKYGWKELSYPAYINHVWNKLKAKGIKTEPFDRSNTNQETLMNFFNKGFNPVFKLYPQANLKAHAQEILRRMKNFGLDVDNTMDELPFYGKKSIKDLVTLSSGRISYIGYYNKPGVTGTFFHNNGTSIIDPGYPREDMGPLKSIVSTMHHERNMHGTLKFLTPEMWKLYENFLNKMFTKTTTDEFGRTVAITTDNSTIPIGKGSLKKEELRATIGELIKDIYDTRAYDRARLVRVAEGGPDIKKSDLEIIRPHFEKVVDEMSDADLNRRLSRINGYGGDYSEIGPKENPNFFLELRTLLKIAPASLPFLIPRKEKKK